MPSDSIPRMDLSGSNESNGSDNDNVVESTPRDVPSTSGAQRIRTDSESSDRVARFYLPSVDGTPPKVLTLDDVSSMVKNIQNMELAHEIALNPEFRLQPYEPPPNSLERRIKDIMHRAFWDSLREDLNKNPPIFKNAIRLLGEIKECFPQIISQQNKRVLERINAVLDEEVITKQAEEGVLDFKAYAAFVLNIMVKSCAPARDEVVTKLNEIDDVVDMFRGILETMSLMKLDMANYLLDSARNDILVHSVEYEKERFKSYLEYYKFGFPHTENWLKRNRTYNENNVPSTTDTTVTNAFMELMNWKDFNEFPEVISMDKDRFFKFAVRGQGLCVAASIMSLTARPSIISQRPENRKELAKNIKIILQAANTNDEVNSTIENIWEQVKKLMNVFLKKENEQVMSDDIEKVLKAQILEVSKLENPVRMLMWKRLQTYFRLALQARPGNFPPPPPGFTDYQEELEAYASSLRRIILYNNSVFGDYFLEILNKSVRKEEDNNDEILEEAAGTSKDNKKRINNIDGKIVKDTIGGGTVFSTFGDAKGNVKKDVASGTSRASVDGIKGDIEMDIAAGGFGIAKPTAIKTNADVNPEFQETDSEKQ